ncbi:MAG: hypothetical protein B6229_04360 [Spirochaetaceae bacterium 4572_7]|nr:MAG: hypothetical protein B6229_04360 [Spirochaetaceae bacterium 4572_7]
MFNWIVYGESQEILDLYIKNQSKDYFATGVLIVNGILFMLLFLSNRGNKPYIYLSLFTLSYGIRSFLLKNTVIQFIYPNFSWELIFQLLKSNELWALAFIILFFRALYPKEFTNKISNIIVYTTVFFSFLVYIPVEYYYQYNLLLTSQIMVIVSGVYILGNLFIAILHKRSLAKRSLFSLTIFFSSIIVDIAANKQFVIFEYYSAQFVILVVLIMFIFIGKERSLTYLRSQLQLKHNRDLKEVFSRFVPFDILKNIGNIDLKDRPPGDFVVKPYTIAYIDIRDFTKLSEGLTPQENFSMINNFYQIVGLAVSSHGGFIESYGGDGVKALFPKSPDDAINTALRISDEVALTSKIKIGISIHFGPIILGTVGSTNRIQATAISDVTRILESMDHFNSKMGIEILISRSVLSLSTLGMNKLLNLGRVILKNEEEDIEVFQVIPDNYHIDELFKEAFDNGVLMVQNKKYSKAYGYFLLANRYQPSHQLTQYYVKKFEMFLKLKGFHFTLKI